MLLTPASATATRPVGSHTPAAGGLARSCLPYADAARSEAVQERAASIRKALGDPKTVFLGIDRLDYTKGIYARLRAFSELIADPFLRERGAFATFDHPVRGPVTIPGWPVRASRSCAFPRSRCSTKIDSKASCA